MTFKLNQPLAISAADGAREASYDEMAFAYATSHVLSGIHSSDPKLFVRAPTGLLLGRSLESLNIFHSR